MTIRKNPYYSLFLRKNLSALDEKNARRAELDEYYYGARYYNPRESVWLSVDPLAEKYPNVSPYAYTFQNPIKYIDPRGLEGEGIDPEDPTDLPEIVITGKRRVSNNKYITNTETISTKVDILPKNIFATLTTYSSSTIGNAGILNIDNKITKNISQRIREISQDYQVDLNIFKGNVEVTKESLGAGVGVSLLGRLDLNIGVNLNADILNSEIYFNGSENINKDNNSNGFSVGIKPVSLIIGTINYGLRRILPPTIVQPSLYTTIFGSSNQGQEMH
ncbi:RHS repeat-associated core domain-containing protein [Apibacter mensalis]|uniref:RHS repeat-associated core domain-containing protein n=1 Tax=Apibacter mensalis TaxID=1586267 RepID=A0A0X3ASA3_9FLAO|nr:RHS repeat-associated core domain-containing protein [Apibacter mensalis]CVK17222.1 RHS repeat-associated core domain-containing protein [Apibacter mensalis]